MQMRIVVNVNQKKVKNKPAHQQMRNFSAIRNSSSPECGSECPGILGKIEEDRVNVLSPFDVCIFTLACLRMDVVLNRSKCEFYLKR